MMTAKLSIYKLVFLQRCKNRVFFILFSLISLFVYESLLLIHIFSDSPWQTHTVCKHYCVLFANFGLDPVKINLLLNWSNPWSWSSLTVAAHIYAKTNINIYLFHCLCLPDISVSPCPPPLRFSGQPSLSHPWMISYFQFFPNHQDFKLENFQPKFFLAVILLIY